MLPNVFSFVDVETSGTSLSFDRVIEIGIVRVEGGQVVREYSTLINPQAYVDPHIELLTGISSSDLEHAPTFYEVRNDILEMLKDSIFVAHNAQFDYGFLKHEFKRFDIAFSPKHFCTAKLARLLFPGYRSYNLRFDEAFYEYKIKVWPFNGPIIVKEAGESEEYFIIDKWCILGSVKRDEEFPNGHDMQYSFDLDAYTILLRFLKDKKNFKKITALENIRSVQSNSY